MSEKTEIKKGPRKISRRQFLRDAGIVVGGTAVGSAFFLSACGEEVEVTKTVTTTAPGGTKTITTTAADNTVTITKYTCPVDGLEFNSLEELKAHYDATHEGVAVAGGTVISLSVNNKEYTLDVKPRWTLQDLLRDQLGLTSPKDMCHGYGACGSCSVIVDGRPVLSCMMLACECDGTVIETSEGIAVSRPDLIDAYVLNHAMQCGYCTPGFVCTTKALLDHNANPTEADIKEALGGNICRCGDYIGHIKAIRQVAGNK